MENVLPFNKADIGEEEIAEVVDVLRSGWLTTGPKVREFARRCGQLLHGRAASCSRSIRTA
jgi:dTDP-4-amino-4,6-dideoxygalactose transaminase